MFRSGRHAEKEEREELKSKDAEDEDDLM